MCTSVNLVPSVARTRTPVLSTEELNCIFETDHFSFKAIADRVCELRWSSPLTSKLWEEKQVQILQVQLQVSLPCEMRSGPGAYSQVVTDFSRWA